jgi:hypothetical protein
MTFDLVSVLFHALDGGSAIQQYIQDAQQSGENELVQFFQQISQQNRQRAPQAEQLLAQRLGGGQPSREGLSDESAEMCYSRSEPST